MLLIKFADDAALCAFHDGFEVVASSFIAVAKGWGLTVSLAIASPKVWWW